MGFEDMRIKAQDALSWSAGVLAGPWEKAILGLVILAFATSMFFVWRMKRRKSVQENIIWKEEDAEKPDDIVEELAGANAGKAFVEGATKIKEARARKKKCAEDDEKEKKIEVMLQRLSRKIEQRAETVEEEVSSLQTVVWIGIAVSLVACAAAGAAYWNADREKASEAEGKESIASALEKLDLENAIEAEKKAIEAEKKKDEAKKVPAISEMEVRVLNESGVAGAAGRIKEFLSEKGYVKAEAGNGENDSTAGTVIFYRSDEFQDEARRIGEMLDEEKDLKSKIEKAGPGQESSADIVVILGT